MAASWDSSLPGTVGQNLLIRVRGDAARARAYLESVRWDLLEGLLKR
jgi:hypothetical protein